MQKQPSQGPAPASPTIASDPPQGRGLFRRRLGRTAAQNLYEKEREEQPGVRLRARTRSAPDDDDTAFDGTGCFSDT